ncbi:putative ATP-dependent RNA helicase TDRD12 [Halyomorpha halys]|uniref:putative ATP-dependent RNA helicase TDRD12 n=1 Tax=Halyomorpha halys TaxID=286706 RepID=UPI0006D52345|nr:putative ATP-dependent RNA helicase TDRD12 isoform X2 [Halyomorpha halys]
MTEEYSSEISNHSLQEGFIEVLNVIDPFTYSVRCQDCLSSEEINLELKRIIPECISLKSDNANKINSLVIVEESDGKYFRGYFKFKEGQNIFYVSRIDVGDDICIQPCNIYCIPEGLFRLEPQRHTIKLYGIIPSPEVTCNQLEDCYSLLISLIYNATNATLNEFYLIDKFFYGTIEIVTHYNNKLSNICLKNILLEKQIALPSHNFEHDVISPKKSQRESIPEHNLYDKVPEGLRNIEITPQHSVYLNALTSGLLINPEHFENFLVGSKTQISDTPTMAVDNKRREDHEMANLHEFSGLGHGRPCPLISHQNEQSGGRGKIKSLLQNVNDKKTILDSQVQRQDEIVKTDFPECGVSEKPESSSVKTNYFDLESDTRVSKNLILNQPVRADSVISKANEIHKISKSEELCFQLLKPKNKMSKSESRNKKAKHLSQSHKLKAHNYYDTPVAFSRKENDSENNFSQNQSEEIPSFQLASNTFSSVNKSSPTKQEPDLLYCGNCPHKSLTHDTSMEVVTESKINSDDDFKNENYEFFCDSRKASSSFNENSHYVSKSESRNIKGKNLSQSHKLKTKNYFDTTVPLSRKEHYSENNFKQNQSEQIPVNPFLLANNTFSSGNKISPIKQEPDKLDTENCPHTSLAHDMAMEVVTESRANTDGDLKQETNEYLYESQKAYEDSHCFVSSPVVNEEKSKSTGNIIKSMGRGFLFNKFSPSQTINYDLVRACKSESVPKFDNDLSKDSKPECLEKSIDYNYSPLESTAENSNYSDDLLRVNNSKDPQKSIYDDDLPKETDHNNIKSKMSNDYEDLPEECNSEVLESKDERNIINDLKDDNDHEDRYFDIEEPTYLNCSKEYNFLDNKTETNQNTVKSDEENYENILNLKQDNEHRPLDDQAFATSPAEAKPEAELLEQKILRDYSVGQIPERMKMSCGLIHGNIIANPVSKLSDLKLEQHVFSNLNAKNMRELSRSQMFAVPVLLQRRNLVLIGPPNSGKTLAYVMSLLSLLHDNDYYSSLKPGNGPRCIFVSSCAQNVNYISQFCSAICGAKLTIITTHGGGLELERKEDLTNGCEILVTTPRCLLRLLRHTSVTNLFRVCHIVFDDVDSLLSIFCPEVKEIMSNLNKMLQIRKRYSNLGIHVVLVGEKWTPILEDITFKALDSPVLCITAHLEAALYARIKPKTYILSPDSKIKKLKELLDCTSKKIRTVIVCRSAGEVKSLRPLVELTLSDVLVAHEEMGLNQLVEVGDLWIRCTSPPILLCSDPILSELAVTNAQWLIHYSMPDNKSSFSERFSTIKEHLYDRIKYPKTVPPECQVHILVDDTNELQFPEIISFMKRLSTSIPNVFLEAVKKISILKEERKIDVPFCENLLMLGHCRKKDKCKKQHIFNKSRDKPQNLPVKGIMKVKLLYAHNPSHYSVRVLATKNSDSDEQWTEFPSNYALIAFKMSNYFSFRENRFAHGRVKIGDLVAIEVEPDLMFKRAKVIDIITRDEKYNPEEIMVHFIDEGSVDKLTTSQLLHLPPELQVYSQEAYDMYLIGLQPVDYDRSWSFASTLKIQKSISNLNFQDGDNKFFTANVALVAGKNLLATSFLCHEWLDLNKCHVVLFSPKKFILETGLAEPNPKHFSTLMNLALDAGLISCIPEEIKKSDTDEDEEKVQWAHLDKENTNIVHVIGSYSPSLFFLKHFKFSDRLEELEKELTALLDSKVTKFDMIERNMLCAAKYPNDDKRWNRGMITDVTKDEVEVFFVDYGDCHVLPLSTLSRLPKGFITRLPFQAIECSLVGILPLDDDWLPQGIEAFDSMCLNDDHQLISMFAKVSDVTNASVTTGRHFKVILAPIEKKDNYINKEMVYRGFANWDVQTKHYLTESIVWSEDTEGDEEWVDDDSQNSDKAGKEDEKKNSDDKPVNTNETEATSSEQTFNDLLSMIENGDFEFGGNPQFLLNLLPPQLQHMFKIKERNIEQALDELHQREDAKSKVPEPISHKPKEDQETSDIVEGPLLESCGLFHPEVYWSQKDCYIRIKINLADINQFQLDYSDQILGFRALANGKYYWFEIALFGLISKGNVSYASKGLYFEIKMEKFIKGEFWPRLLYEDFKYPWIKLDPDYIEQDDLSLIESMFKKGMKFKPTIILGNPDIVPSSSEPAGVPEPDSDLESVSSRSDNEEFTDLVHDSIDPESD